MTFDKAEAKNSEKQEAAQTAPFDVVQNYKDDQLSKSAEKNNSDKSATSDKTSSNTDPAKDASKEMSASQIADLIIKNNGFGKLGSEDRGKLDSALGKSFDKSMSDADASKELTKKVNEELAKKNSDLRVDFESKGGGGGGGRRKDGLHETHQEKDGTFNVTEKGKPVDGMSMHAEKDTVYDKTGKVVGEQKFRESENGGSGGGWGKAAEAKKEQNNSSKDQFKLDDFILEDKAGSGSGGGKGGGGGGGKGGGKTKG